MPKFKFNECVIQCEIITSNDGINYEESFGDKFLEQTREEWTLIL